MKNYTILSLAFVLIAVLSATLYFFGKVTVFHWTAWICLVPVFLMMVVMISLFEDKDMRPAVTIYAVLSVLPIAGGFIFTRKAVDAILLGSCFFCFIYCLILCFKRVEPMGIAKKVKGAEEKHGNRD